MSAEPGPLSAEKLDYLELAAHREDDIRVRFENDEYDVHILGFVKQMGDIADGARSAFSFFLLAFVLTAISVVHEGPDKVHLSLNYDRCREDGSVYNSFDTLWVATLQDGHWGIQFRSSYLR